MKNNFMKSITLFSLLILVSCNSVSYKYDEPLFISGDKASESVKENLFEKTKNMLILFLMDVMNMILLEQ